MSFFDKIKTAIFGDHGRNPTAPVQHAPASPAAPAPAPSAPTPATQTAAPAPAPVDVEAVLTAKAAALGKPSNWHTSIVDLLQLIGLDSSLAARKELANELNIHVGADGSAEENIALHKAVMKKLAENGGKVPADLQD